MITLKYFSIWSHFFMAHKHLLRRKTHLVNKDEMFLSNIRTLQHDSLTMGHLGSLKCLDNDCWALSP